MKALSGRLTLLFCTLLISMAAFAWGDSGCGSGSCGDNPRMDDGGCRASVCSECQCTDYVCIRNTNSCIDKATCCEAFGNVGAR